MTRVAFAGAAAGLSLVLGVAFLHAAPAAPERLAETGFSRALPQFVPQYPLWSDGAVKARWVWLPPGATIDTRDPDAWQFPVGTKFWKEFSFGGRRVETRMLWKASSSEWVSATYVWNDAQTDAVLAPPDGVRGVAEVAPGKFHSIPSIEDCRACHESGRTQILGFTALQLSTDRDPNALHAEPLTEAMVTLRTLHDAGLTQPARPEWLASPPRIRTSSPRERAVLGYLSTNCGSCHNAGGTLSNLSLNLRQPQARGADAVLTDLRDLTTKWDRPGTVPGTTRALVPGDPSQSAIAARMRSRRPSSQMPPLGTVIPDHQAIAAVEQWIAGL